MRVAESSNGVFIGVTVPLGYALIGTGTQHAVIGSKAWGELEGHSMRLGYDIKILPTLELVANGVGGSSKFKLSAEIPVGNIGYQTTLQTHVLDQDVPPLLPVQFLRDLGTTLGLNHNVATWEKLGTSSAVYPMPQSGHLAVDITQFPNQESPVRNSGGQSRGGVGGPKGGFAWELGIEKTRGVRTEQEERL